MKPKEEVKTGESVKLSIRFKVAAVILSILLVSIALSIAISVINQRNNLLESKQDDLITNNNILNTVIRNIMLDGEAPLAVRTMSDIRDVAGFEQIEIYRRNGQVAFSDYETLEEVNRNLDMIMFDETPRLEIKTMETESFQKVVGSNTPQYIEDIESREMRYYFPILNYSECRACHGTDHFVRGVAYYQVSLETAFQRIGRARNTLVIFFLATGVAIAVILILLMQRIIVAPVMSIGGVVSEVGTGNLDVESKVKSADELGLLSSKINTMIEGLKERRMLQIEKEVIEARDEENRKYLDNINEGLLLINRDYTISNQYSRFLTDLFAAEEIAGRNFIDFIYPDEEKFSQQRQELERFLKMLFVNTSTEMEMIMSINPLSNVTLEIGSDTAKRQIIIDTDFQRIYREGNLENVMVIFTDKTDIVRVRQQLEQEQQRSRSELEQIAAILNNGPQAFLDFDRDSRKTLKELDKIVSSKPGAAALQTSTRELHSLKGSARYMELRHISELAHALESDLEDIKSGKEEWKDETVRRIPERIDEIYKELDNVRKLNEKFKDFTKAADENNPEQEPLESFLIALKKMIENISEEMNKEVEVLLVNKLDNLPPLPRIKNSLIHLARNALDHGIEDEIERISSGKKEPGKIKFRFIRDDDNYIITITDNGRGIDFDAVYRSAREKNLITGDREEYSDKKLLKLLFSSDFSTKPEVSELSGRGVGLDVVQDEVHKAGGRLSVMTEKGKGTRVTLSLPVHGDNS